MNDNIVTRKYTLIEAVCTTWPKGLRSNVGLGVSHLTLTVHSFPCHPTHCQ